MLVVMLAVASAAIFAVGSALQHRSAGTAPRSSRRQMLLTLLRRPSWLLGAALSATAFALHAVALSRGDLAAVQPIILSGIVFAVMARSVIDRRLPSAGEVGWALVTWAGLALFIALLRPGAAHRPDELLGIVMVGTGVAGVTLLAVVARRNRSRQLLHGVLLACGSGILFGLVAGLLKLSTLQARQGLVVVLTHWPVWALLLVGGAAVVMNQSAYQSARMSVSTSLLNICQLAVSLGFGLLVFRERLASSPAVFVVECLGLALMVLGVTQLARRAAERPGPEPEPAGSEDGPARAVVDDPAPSAGT